LYVTPLVTRDVEEERKNNGRSGTERGDQIPVPMKKKAAKKKKK
jgi:hypothetical protein